MVQFDAVQTDDRINITIGDKPATIGRPQVVFGVFPRPGVQSCHGPAPEIGVFAVPKGEADTGLRSDIAAPWQWHNYAVRFNLREKRLTVWVDRQCRGTIDLAGVTQGTDTRGRPIVGQLALDQSIRDHRRLFPERAKPHVDRQLSRRVAAGSRTIEPVCVTVKENRMGYDFVPRPAPRPPEATF